MCGIWGYVAKGNRRPNLRLLEDLAFDTEKRGKHAFGFAWVDQEGRIRHFKQAGRIGDYIGLLALMQDARVIIAHCRYATRGDPADNCNNHPFCCDGGFLIHNGSLPDYDSLLVQHDLWPTSECDSEAIALLIEKEKGTRLQRCVRAVNRTEPGNLAVAGLWGRPARVALIRRGKPLWQAQTAGGSLYFASRPYALPRGATEMKDNTAELWTPAGLLEATDAVD